MDGSSTIAVTPRARDVAPASTRAPGDGKDTAGKITRGPRQSGSFAAKSSSLEKNMRMCYAKHFAQLSHAYPAQVDAGTELQCDQLAAPARTAKTDSSFGVRFVKEP